VLASEESLEMKGFQLMLETGRLDDAKTTLSDRRRIPELGAGNWKSI